MADAKAGQRFQCGTCGTQVIIAATCRQAEKAGGTVHRAPRSNADGFTFAYLLDPSGNQFEVFTPPSRRP